MSAEPQEDPLDLAFPDDARLAGDQFHRGDEDETVALLKDLAAGGPALELGIGTGRIALPLAAEGIRVDGIDISEENIAELRRKPGGAALSVTIGNFADVAVPGSYRLIYVVWNTLFNLVTQDEQVRCFQNVEAHLADGGVFLIEAYTPAWIFRLERDQYVDAEAVGAATVRLDVARHDPVTQTLYENHVTLTESGVRFEPVITRHSWPGELDLMGRIAGLRLLHRWGGFSKQPFTSRSHRHVSVYGR
jgi:hypothetical protein